MSEKLWTRITEIPMDEMPATGKYSELFHELLLRLEQTPPRFVLAVEMADARTARAAAQALRWMFSRRLGNYSVVTSYAGSVLYVRRGKSWGQKGKGAK